MPSNLLEFLLNLGDTLKVSMLEVYNWLVTDITIFDTSYSMYEVLFGGALTIVLTYAAIKFVLNIFG